MKAKSSTLKRVLRVIYNEPGAGTPVSKFTITTKNQMNTKHEPGKKVWLNLRGSPEMLVRGEDESRAGVIEVDYFEDGRLVTKSYHESQLTDKDPNTSPSSNSSRGQITQDQSPHV